MARGSAMVKALLLSHKVVGLRVHEMNDFFSIYLIFPAALGPGVHSASTRIEYQKQQNKVSGE
jgi:hypothetical protein